MAAVVCSFCFILSPPNQCLKLRALGKRKEVQEMKEWAKQFYLSEAWQDTRQAYLSSHHYLCERCGEPAKIAHHKTYITRKNINNPDITLNQDNLEALCQDCHNKEHHKKQLQSRYKFDADGNIIQNRAPIPPI